MFGSRSPRLSVSPPFSVNSVPSALKFSPKRHTKLCPSPTTQLVPSFSTTRKHFTRTYTHRPLSLRALLRDSPHAPGAAIHCALALIPFPPNIPLNPLEATLTNPPVSVDHKRPTKNLNPLNATLTKIAGGASPHGSATHYSPRHHSLLTLPINPLHYAFEAHYDS
jgi:hypothetical protein